VSDREEIERIKHGGLGPTLPVAKWEFGIDLGQNPDDIWKRIIGVVESVVAFDYDSWPDDEDYWRAILPDWLSSFMMTREECDAALARVPREQWDELIPNWEFGSWLDAIRERDWRWWGYERSGSEVRLVLQVTGIPPRIDAFKQILLASGAKILSEAHD
jgi:hypothetical protein